MRGIPFEHRQEIFESLYGKPGATEETVAVDGVNIEVSTLEKMREMQAKARAKRESRTDPEQAE